ncbi:hypothetical protein P5P81_01910 [Tritonibacter mobilis]|nr:hypothetical protein [Tritonibacter mobilis]
MMPDSLITWLSILFFLGFAFWNYRRHKRRRDSLKREPDGTWVWVDFDGSENRSTAHPARPGGKWWEELRNQN